MCGIVGILKLNKNSVDKNTFLEMIDILSHRGPDDKGIFIDGAIGLGHRRLTVIDLSSAGHQPMANEDETIWIVYNGEIYNFLEIKKDLEKKGHKFRSKTDAEVVIHAYEEWGINCLQKFNGMWAFAIWDKKNQQLFLARDRIGKKPLYYYSDNNEFIFASEIKAILKANIKKELNLQGVINYFTFAHSIAPETIYQGIKKLLAGHYLILRDEKIKIEKYWSQPLIEKKEDKGENYYKEKILEILENSVKLRLISDVPLGVFLSGGIDSSSVVALMAKSGARAIKTFSVGFNVEGEEFNELADAKIIADFFKTEHHKIVLKELDLVNTLEKLVYHFDEPFGDAANFPVFYMSQFAKNYVKVVLTGEGGDEIFGGYRRYLIEKNRKYFPLLSTFCKSNITKNLIYHLPGLRRVKKFINTFGIENELKRYSNWLTYFDKGMQKELLNPQFLGSYFDGLLSYKKYYSQVKNFDILDKIMYIDQRILLTDCYCEKVDKASMAVGLEARAPFLDYRLIEFAFQIPSKYKIRGFKMKYILKRTMENLLPQPILKKAKHGFAVPTSLWFKGLLKNYLFEILFDKRTRSRGYFNFDYIEKIYNAYKKGKGIFNEPLWLILNFELWHREFMDK